MAETEPWAQASSLAGRAETPMDEPTREALAGSPRRLQEGVTAHHAWKSLRCQEEYFGIAQGIVQDI